MGWRKYFFIQEIGNKQEDHLYTNVFNQKELNGNPMTTFLMELFANENKNCMKQLNKEAHCFFKREKGLHKETFGFNAG